ASSRLFDEIERTIEGRIAGICTNVNSRNLVLLFSIAESKNEAEAGPGFVDGTDLVVDQTVGQPDSAADVLGEIGRNYRGTLWPGDPEPGAGAERLDGFRERLDQFITTLDEHDHEIEGRRRQRRREGDASGQGIEARLEPCRCADQRDVVIGLEAEF